MTRDEVIERIARKLLEDSHNYGIDPCEFERLFSEFKGGCMADIADTFDALQPGDEVGEGLVVMQQGAEIYSCPICHSNDKTRYLRCQDPQCPDGRDQ